jgi:hypothetical protein
MTSGKGASAADEIVVAVDAGDDGVIQAQRSHGLGHAAWLVEVNRLGTAFGHRAEAAAARTQVAQHHEGCGFVVPALADVGAVRALADGIQLQRAGQPLQAVVVLAHRRARLEPLGLGRRSRAGWGNLHQFHHVFIVLAAKVPKPWPVIRP